MSRARDAWSTYQTSMASRSSHPVVLRPLTWAQPVMPGPHLQPAGLDVVVPREVGHRQRPRSDEGHVTAHDVDERRQLVEARRSQQPAHAGHPRHVVLRTDLVRASRSHRAELDELERPATATASGLVEQHRWTVEDPHRKSDRRDQRRSDHQQRGGDDEVDRPLHHDRDPTARRAAATSTASPRATRIEEIAIVSVRAAVRAMPTAKPACRPTNAAGCTAAGTMARRGPGTYDVNGATMSSPGIASPATSGGPPAGAPRTAAQASTTSRPTTSTQLARVGAASDARKRTADTAATPIDVIRLRHAEVEADGGRHRPAGHDARARAACDGRRGEAAHCRHAGGAGARPCRQRFRDAPTDRRPARCATGDRPEKRRPRTVQSQRSPDRPARHRPPQRSTSASTSARTSSPITRYSRSGPPIGSAMSNAAPGRPASESVTSPASWLTHSANGAGR